MMPNEERVESFSPSEEEQTAGGGEGGTPGASSILGGFPDVNKTPTVNAGAPGPLPYPNTGNLPLSNMEGEEAPGSEEKREAKATKDADNTDSGAFLDNSGDIVLDADITDEARQRLAPVPTVTPAAHDITLKLKEDGVWEELDDDVDWADSPEMKSDVEDTDDDEDEDEEM